MTATEDRRAALARICAAFKVTILYVFGSRSAEVRGWLHESVARLEARASDVDIGVKAAPGAKWTAREKVALAIALEDLLGCGRVDLVVLDEADPFVAEEVIGGERLWARDENEADEYDLYVLRRAGDLAPLRRERDAMVLRTRK
jgi:predicted nucleotidyltransferase